MNINLGRSVRVLISLYLLLALTSALAFLPLGTGIGSSRWSLLSLWPH